MKFLMRQDQWVILAIAAIEELHGMEKMKTGIVGNGSEIKTDRLYLREMTPADFPLLGTMLQDMEVMHAWEHAFTDDEVQQWIKRNIERYQSDGYGYWLAFDEKSGECIGQMGLLAEEIFGVKHIGIGWILAKKHWRKGYAVEGATACKDYAFNTLKAPRVIADIRIENVASIRVAERIGMKAQGQFDKIYKNKKMPHGIYVVRSPLVEVVPYQPHWEEQFRALAQLLTPIVTDFGGTLEHVGSTSVVGLAAKPVIDADYILADPALWPQVKERLKKLGFYHRGDLGLPGREVFTESLHLAFRHNLYVCMPESIHLANHLKLRDYWRRHPQAARRYGELKIQLAKKYPADVDLYCEGKSDLLSEFLAATGFEHADIKSIHTLNQCPQKLK